MSRALERGSRHATSSVAAQSKLHERVGVRIASSLHAAPPRVKRPCRGCRVDGDAQSSDVAPGKSAHDRRAPCLSLESPDRVSDAWLDATPLRDPCGRSRSRGTERNITNKCEHSSFCKHRREQEAVVHRSIGRRFKLVRRLGAGGNGVVYDAIDRSTGGRNLHSIEPISKVGCSMHARFLKCL